MYLLCVYLKNFVAIVKKNPACLNDLVNSTQPVNNGKKATSSTQKGNFIKQQVRKYPSAFPKNPKETTKPDIQSVSPDNESAESESKYPQVHEIINNATI